MCCLPHGHFVEYHMGPIVLASSLYVESTPSPCLRGLWCAQTPTGTPDPHRATGQHASSKTWWTLFISKRQRPEADNWLRGTSVRCLAPAVFAAVPKRKRCVTVVEALHGRAWVHHVTGPRTMRLLTEFIGLCNTLEVGSTLAGCSGHLWLEADGRSAVLRIVGLWGDVRWLL
jgi:hypothetical protein